MIDEKTLLTVIIPTFNRCDYLKQAIDAVLTQKYDNFKLIILDNASTDNTGIIVRSYKDNRLSYVCNPENIGGLANINRAIELADTKYFIILHDDDYAAPDLFGNEIAVLESDADIVMVAANTYIIDTNDRIICKSLNIKKDFIYQKGKYFIDFIKNRNKISCPTVMFRTEFMKENKLQFQNFVGPASDTYLWMNINLYEKKIYIISKPLYYYRLHESQDSKMNFFTMVMQLYDALLILFNEKGYEKYSKKLSDYVYNLIMLFLLTALAKENIAYSDYSDKVSILNSKIKNPKKKLYINILANVSSISEKFYINLYKIYSFLKRQKEK